MVLRKEDFEKLDLADLLLNIWSNSFSLDPILIQYNIWNIEFAKKKWKKEYQDFDKIILKILRHDKPLKELGKISSEI